MATKTASAPSSAVLLAQLDPWTLERMRTSEDLDEIADLLAAGNGHRARLVHALLAQLGAEHGPPAECYIGELPFDVFCEIVSHLTAREVCQSVEPVCRDWRMMAKEGAVWQRLCAREGWREEDILAELGHEAELAAQGVVDAASLVPNPHERGSGAWWKFEFVSRVHLRPLRRFQTLLAKYETYVLPQATDPAWNEGRAQWRRTVTLGRTLNAASRHLHELGTHMLVDSMYTRWGDDQPHGPFNTNILEADSVAILCSALTTLETRTRWEAVTHSFRDARAGWTGDVHRLEREVQLSQQPHEPAVTVDNNGWETVVTGLGALTM